VPVLPPISVGKAAGFLPATYLSISELPSVLVCADTALRCICFPCMFLPGLWRCFIRIPDPIACLVCCYLGPVGMARMATTQSLPRRSIKPQKGACCGCLAYWQKYIDSRKTRRCGVSTSFGTMRIELHSRGRRSRAAAPEFLA
jgi:hypothetical protein